MAGTVVDLFSGCGGFGLSAHQAGFDVVAAVDVDVDLTWSHTRNFPNTRMLVGDLATPDIRTILGDLMVERIDGVIGGPPCQGFSVIGRGRSGDLRNDLVGAFFRHVETIRPRFFVMENVAGLLAPGNRGLLDHQIDMISRHYHVGPPLRLNAKDFGAPTDRRRVVVVGIRRGEAGAFDPSLLTPETQPTRVRDAIWDLTDVSPSTDVEGDLDWWDVSASGSSAFATSLRADPIPNLGWEPAVTRMRQRRISGMRRTIHAPYVIERFANLEPGKRDPVGRHQRLKWDGISPTLRAGTGREFGSYQSVRPIHPSEPRVITTREAARLQGFPDWFVFHPTIWHSFRMIGNSVSPFMGTAVLRAVRQTFEARSGNPRVASVAD